MCNSIALIDWLSGIMDPEELPQFSVLIDFAEDHGLYPEALLEPVVGEGAALVYRACLSLGEGRTEQAHIAGVTAAVRERILDAFTEVPAVSGVCARWEAAMAAAREAGLRCAPWAAVADVAMLVGWTPSRDLLCYVMLHAASDVARAARCVMLLRDGADPLDAWEGHYGALSVGGE